MHYVTEDFQKSVASSIKDAFKEMFKSLQNQTNH